MPEYSFKKTLKKVGETFIEISTSLILSVAPQIVDLIFAYFENTPPSQLHIPVEWAGFWMLAIRGLRNYWKNR